ncbi:MAG: hypothetical protein IH586_13005 [Anaerolineaceae bacterium]|nr:hypothetical protein [Anaerolineaceae bacterium]
MMKKAWLRFLYRGWIASTSIAVFIGGWAIIGHAGKPAASNLVMDNNSAQLAPLPTLAPLPLLDNGSTIRVLPQQPPSVQLSQPRFRTRGS